MAGGSASKHTLESFFGRVDYNFNQKYLVEFDARYDGSSRFPKNQRWGLFPSFSAAWRISNEKFLEDVSWISNLKVRGSWGRLGNQSIGNYPYQSVISLGANYPFGSSVDAGGAVTTIPTKDITWETTTITDIGIDMALFSNKFKITADYYKKNTTGILYNISVSEMYGASPAPTNAGAVVNKGWNFSSSYNNNMNDFHYSISANFSINHNKVTELANVERDVARGLFVGYPIGSSYGYISNGIYNDMKELKNSPPTPFALMEHPGGIKLKDIGGSNGEPDGKVTAQYDRTVIGNPIPNTSYGLTLMGGYKGFDFYLLFQGSSGRKIMVPNTYFYPLGNNGNVQQFIFDNRWNPDHPNANAKFPRIIRRGFGYYVNNKMTLWFRSATFVRLKTVQISYSLPVKLLSNSPFDKIRIYISGQNLATITGFYPGWDPEMQVGGGFYPLMKKYIAGIEISI